MTNSVTLLQAARVIEANGLAHEDYFEPALDEAGRLRPPHECQVCPRGAIAVAIGAYPSFMADYDLQDEDEHTKDEDATAEEIRPVERALLDHLLDVIGWTPSRRSGTTPGERSPTLIEIWADEPDRTQPQVIGVMRSAAEAEREDGR